MAGKLSQIDQARVMADFIEWSGGYTASEVESEQIDLYVAVAMPSDMNSVDVEAFLTEWAEVSA